jgi:hypothetical protein
LHTRSGADLCNEDLVVSIEVFRDGMEHSVGVLFINLVLAIGAFGHHPATQTVFQMEPCEPLMDPQDFRGVLLTWASEDVVDVDRTRARARGPLKVQTFGALRTLAEDELALMIMSLANPDSFSRVVIRRHVYKDEALDKVRVSGFEDLAT